MKASESFMKKYTRGDYQAAINGIITRLNAVFARYPQICYLVGLHAMARSMAVLLGPAKPESRANWVSDLPGLLRANIAALDKAHGRGPRRPLPGIVNDSNFELTSDEGLLMLELLEPMSQAMIGQPRIVGLLALSRMMSALLAEAPDEIAEHTCQLIPEVVADFIVALDHVAAEMHAEQQQATAH